jgi:hypothetical protein
MIGTAVLIALNALVWGTWSLLSVTSSSSSFEQALWYIYGPLAVFLSSVVVPIIALATGHLRQGPGRSWLRAALLLVLLGFLPYAFMSGGGV